jgi:hypothetical protein
VRALFIKELKQGRSLLLFGVIMAVLVAIGNPIVRRVVLLYSGFSDAQLLAVFFGLVLLPIPPLIAILAGSGMFAGEVHGGTLPLLFALPISRPRIWLSMALAALGLTVVSSLLLFGVARLLVPTVFAHTPLRAYLPDLICWTMFLLAAGLFCSALTRSLTTGVACTVILAAVIIYGAIALVIYYGAPLLGLPPLDVALWCLLAVPSLLLLSLLPVTRGELLSAPRKCHALTIMLLPVSLAFTIFVVCLLARAATGYDRSDIVAIHSPRLQGGGRHLVLRVRANPAELALDRFEIAATAQDTYASLADDAIWPTDYRDKHVTTYRSNYVVALDLETGGELLIARDPGRYPFDRGIVAAAVSPDGKLVAISGDEAGLTWGRPSRGDQRLRILDVETGDEVYAGNVASNLLWSPTAKYLATASKRPGDPDTANIRVIRRDGSQPRRYAFRLASWSWAPNEDVIYGFNREGALCRVYPEGGQLEVVWSPEPDSEVEERRFSSSHIAPDGRWIILTETISRTAEDEFGNPFEEQVTPFRLVNTEDGRSQEIWRAPDEWTALRDLRWFPDGTVVALLQLKRDLAAHRAPFHLLRMRPGEGRFFPVGWQTEATYVRLLVGSTTDEAFVHAQWWAYPDKQEPTDPYVPPTLEREELTAVSMDGSARQIELPPAPGATPYAKRTIGFDNQGRLIAYGTSGEVDFTGEEILDYIEAFDLDTGELTRVYP